MYKTKLCLGTMASLGIPDEEQIKLFAKVGFEAYFVEWKKGYDLGKALEAGEKAGIPMLFVHAPFSGDGNVSALWEQNERTERSFSTLTECIKDCADHGIKLIVFHAFIGFDKHEPTEFGVKNFEKLVDYAATLGVNIAFENTEGEEYLERLMAEFKDKKNVGFCWDTGHEMCYNRSKDMLSLYGDRLLCTHINDNLGIKDFDGKITYIDDLHLLPFDGIGDWEDITERLVKHGFDGYLTFELTVKSKPGRHENDMYAALSPEEYVARAYMRACKVASLYSKKRAR